MPPPPTPTIKEYATYVKLVESTSESWVPGDELRLVLEVVGEAQGRGVV